MPSSKTYRSKRLFDPGSAPIVTKRWKDMSLDAKLYFYTIATNIDFNSRAFTIQFTKPTRKLAERSVMQTKDYFAQRMRDALPGIPMFFILEVSDRDLLHIHGLLNPLDRKDEEIKRTLKKVAGDGRKSRTLAENYFFQHRTVNYKPTNWKKSPRSRPDRFGAYGWYSYMVKHIAKTQKFLGTRKSLISVRRSVTQAAIQMHKEDCDASSGS